MILDKSLKVKIAKYNIEHYKQFFDVKLKDIIEVDIELHLQKKSNIKVNVQCDLCPDKRYISYQNYIKNISSSKEYPIYTCDKCSHVKIKAYNKNRYGVEYYSQTKDYEIKFKNTMLNKYGVEHALQNIDLKKKAVETSRNNYGVDNIFMDNEFIKSKFNDKYGVYHPMMVDKFKEKSIESNKKTMLLKKDLIINKRKITNKERFGKEHFAQTKEYKENSLKHNMNKYGFEHSLQVPELKEKSRKSCLENNNGEYLDKHMGDDVPEEMREAMVRDVMERLQARGLSSGNVESTLNKLRKKRKDYLKEIKRAVSNMIFGTIKQKTIVKPNRRQIAGLKGNRKVKTEVNVILDTSGSMGGQGTFERVLNYVYRNDISINLMESDTEVKWVEKIKSSKKLQSIPIKGLGGTALNPAINYVRENFNYANTVVLTDGYTDSLDFRGIKGKVLIISVGTKCPIAHSNGKIKQIALEANE